MSNDEASSNLLRYLEVLHVHVDVVRHADADDAVGRRKFARADDVALRIGTDRGPVDDAGHAVALHLERDRLLDAFAGPCGLVHGVVGGGTLSIDVRDARTELAHDEGAAAV